MVIHVERDTCIAPPRHGHHRRDRRRVQIGYDDCMTPVMWGVPVRWGCAHTPANAVQGFRLLGRRGVQRIVCRCEPNTWAATGRSASRTVAQAADNKVAVVGLSLRYFHIVVCSAFLALRLAFGQDPKRQKGSGVGSRRALAVPPCKWRLVSSADVMCRRNCLRDRVGTYDVLQVVVPEEYLLRCMPRRPTYNM